MEIRDSRAFEMSPIRQSVTIIRAENKAERIAALQADLTSLTNQVTEELIERSTALMRELREVSAIKSLHPGLADNFERMAGEMEARINTALSIQAKL